MFGALSLAWNMAFDLFKFMDCRVELTSFNKNDNKIDMVITAKKFELQVEYIQSGITLSDDDISDLYIGIEQNRPSLPYEGRDWDEYGFCYTFFDITYKRRLYIERVIDDAGIIGCKVLWHNEHGAQA